MAERPKILCVCDRDDAWASVPQALRDAFDVVIERDVRQACARLQQAAFAGLFVIPSECDASLQLTCLLRNEQILAGMPDGVALLNLDYTILWANARLYEWCGRPELTGQGFFAAWDKAEILGPDFCPFSTALAAGRASSSTLRVGDHRFFEIHAAPVLGADQTPTNLIVTVRDITEEKLQQQKLAAIHKAGIELTSLRPEEVFQMEVEDRIELLKSNILEYTNNLLHFDVVEIRLLDQESQELRPLLQVGMKPDAAERLLFARPRDNGVTGFVAATGKSYLCEDTSEDRLYLEAFEGAKSSLTVPLMWNDQVIGTFNVESPEPRAFSESDLQFLEIFSRNVAAALNTLELLVAQKANTAQQSVEAIHSAVALPVDEILNDAVNVIERYIDHDPELVERLQDILLHARNIKQVIQRIGQTMAPAEAVPAIAQVERRPKLENRRVLVVDADESVRNDAHQRLDRLGCEVETAHEGREALLMVRHRMSYDVIIADIRLPDMTGYELMLKLMELMDRVPLILMSSFGWDPGHSIVNARRIGLHPRAILYKPFRLEKLLETVETILDVHSDVSHV
ncbi:MAG: response regulator [Pirellulaceae bacterium]|nr:response regulator [Pirellulaceae bacterium]